LPEPRYNDAGVSQSARSVVLVKNERNHSTKSPHRRRHRHRCAGALSQVKYLFSLEIRKFLSLFSNVRDPPISFGPFASLHRNEASLFPKSRRVTMLSEGTSLLLAIVYPLRKSQANFRQVESVPNRLHT